jgi:hypothetical protein
MSSWKSVTMAAAVVGLMGGAIACAGSSNSVGTGCSGLSACCSMLPSDEVDGCQAVASAPEATDSDCNDALVTYQGAGFCAGGGGAGSADSGATGCGALSACCPSVPVAGDPAACAMVASDGTEEACQESLEAYQTAGYCSSGDTLCKPGFCMGGPTAIPVTQGCASLASCCGTLSATEAEACDSIVSEGDDSACAETLSDLQSAGSCS